MNCFPVEQCPISSPLINRAIAEFWKWGRDSQSALPLHEVEFFANAEDSELLVELSVQRGSCRRKRGAEWRTKFSEALPRVIGVVGGEPGGADRSRGTATGL